MTFPGAEHPALKLFRFDSLMHVLIKLVEDSQN